MFEANESEASMSGFDGSISGSISEYLSIRCDVKDCASASKGTAPRESFMCECCVDRLEERATNTEKTLAQYKRSVGDYASLLFDKQAALNDVTEEKKKVEADNAFLREQLETVNNRFKMATLDSSRLQTEVQDLKDQLRKVRDPDQKLVCELRATQVEATVYEKFLHRLLGQMYGEDLVSATLKTMLQEERTHGAQQVLEKLEKEGKQ